MECHQWHINSLWFRHTGTVPGRPAIDHLYQHSDNPSTATRTVSFTVNDGDANSNTQTRDIAITTVNDAPVQASIEGSALGYTENAGAVAITSTITVTDVDDTNIESAVVQITANYTNGKTSLRSPTKTASLVRGMQPRGELTLTGSATLAQYQAALRFNHLYQHQRQSIHGHSHRQLHRQRRQRE